MGVVNKDGNVMKIELLQVLTPVYNHAEVGKAEQRMLDTKAELSKWEDEVAKIRERRDALRRLSALAECKPDIGMFLESERDACYTALAQAEAKVASCLRKIEETEIFLRRADKAHEVLGWRK